MQSSSDCLLSPPESHLRKRLFFGHLSHHERHVSGLPEYCRHPTFFGEKLHGHPMKELFEDFNSALVSCIANGGSKRSDIVA